MRLRWVDAVDEAVDTFSQATEFTESTPNAETMSLEDACLLFATTSHMLLSSSLA